jgi:8-oxo-dGTP pyrophosphatase MutT (NUDIX family)
MRRATTMAFAPRMHVYPGGRVDDSDYAADVSFAVDDAEVSRLAERASTDVAGLKALYSCAARELAEEVGVTVGGPPGGPLMVDPSAFPLVEHWVTPEMEAKRYDVRFFMAVLPAGQEAALLTTEADAAFWITPAAALASRRDMAMLPPTEVTLRLLGGFATSADALAEGARRPVLPLMPKRIVEDDGSARWALVNHRTDAVILDPIPGPHTREVDGLPMDLEP